MKKAFLLACTSFLAVAILNAQSNGTSITAVHGSRPVVATPQNDHDTTAQPGQNDVNFSMPIVIEGLPHTAIAGCSANGVQCDSNGNCCSGYCEHVTGSAIDHCAAAKK
ncbi:MAG TPA: hypothetical protein VHW70_01880 [Edaphobacter sp.]|jgi:hypothetical protein|nr:hypothetical protein [Edaphobacter sp.]